MADAQRLVRASSRKKISYKHFIEAYKKMLIILSLCIWLFRPEVSNVQPTLIVSGSDQ